LQHAPERLAIDLPPGKADLVDGQLRPFCQTGKIRHGVELAARILED
jgi:hypothetical protein